MADLLIKEKTGVLLAPIESKNYKDFLGSDIKAEVDGTKSIDLVEKYDFDMASLKFTDIRSCVLELVNIDANSSFWDSSFIDKEGDINNKNYKNKYLFYSSLVHSDFITSIGDNDEIRVYNLFAFCVSTLNFSAENPTEDFNLSCIEGGTNQYKIPTGLTNYTISFGGKLNKRDVDFSLVEGSLDMAEQDRTTGKYKGKSKDPNKKYIVVFVYFTDKATDLKDFGMVISLRASLGGIPLSSEVGTATFNLEVTVNNESSPLLIKYRMDEYPLFGGNPVDITPVARDRKNKN